jgi:hypothetical protein
MVRGKFVATRLWVLLALLLVLPASGQVLPGVGFNPFPGAPDPWDVAIAKGLVADRYTELRWEANPLPGDAHYIGGVPGDPDVNRAWMQRYGIPTTQPFPMGAEFEQTLWPNVLQILWRHGELGGATYNGSPTNREVRDASAAANKSMICRAFSLERSPGYVPEVPYPVFAPELPSGVVLVPGRKARGEPAGFALWRSGYGCDFWYLNSAKSPTPPADPPEEPGDRPIPSPEPCPTCPSAEPCSACPQPQPCPTCPACPDPPQLSDDARQTVQWLTTATLLTGPGRRARVARLLRELEALGLMRSKP